MPHWKHPEEFPNCPAVQGVQLPEPATDQEPAEHGPQGAEPPGPDVPAC